MEATCAQPIRRLSGQGGSLNLVIDDATGKKSNNGAVGVRVAV
jgi:hypothetical protein